MNAYPKKKSVYEYGIVSPSALFKQALTEDSNRIGDWMWYAEQLQNDSERLYCFERVIYIDPTHHAARKAVRIIKNAALVQPVDVHHLSITRLFRGAGA